MNDQHDDSLNNHIRQVFENFEDPTADEGWLLLREKFPDKRKKRPVAWLWWSSAAAMMLLALGITMWVNQNTEVNKATVYTKPKKSIDTIIGNTVAVKKSTPDSIHLPGDNYLTLQPSVNKNSGFKSPLFKHNNIAADQPNISNKPDAVIKSNKTNYTQSAETPVIANQSNVSNKPDASINLNKIDKVQPTETQIAVTSNNNTNTIAPPVANNNSTNTIASSEKPTSVEKQPVVQKPVKPLLYAGNALKDNKPKETEKLNEKPVKFGVYAATYFNYAEGSNNQLNMGVGFTSDIRITKNLKLSTGMAVGQNSLNYNNQAPTPAIKDKAFAYALDASNSNSVGFTSTSPTVKNYNAVLVGLDVPINLKYDFNPQKSRSYVSVGLSSGTFINQSYTYRYAIQSVSSLGTLQESAPQTSTNSFGDFYFARTLNVSVGIGYPLGKKNHLIIEPFLKYPLAGLGSQQIHFGSSGINLKFDFQSAKK